ncbi:hypothetical protein [Ruegeria arenilitoris]|nr:hypothetical protein [Ruegeria arenilitoris]
MAGNPQPGLGGNIAAKPVTDQPQISMVTNHFQAARLDKRLA